MPPRYVLFEVGDSPWNEGSDLSRKQNTHLRQIAFKNQKDYVNF